MASEAEKGVVDWYNTRKGETQQRFSRSPQRHIRMAGDIAQSHRVKSALFGEFYGAFDSFYPFWIFFGGEIFFGGVYVLPSVQ